MKIKIFLTGFILFSGIYSFGQVNLLPDQDEKDILNKQPVCHDAKSIELFQNNKFLKQTGNANLVAYFPFNGNANDESGNGNDGSVSGATLTADRFGMIGSAYYFNGSSDFIGTSNIATTATDTWSITAWIKPATLNQLGSVVINGFDDGGGSNNGYSILLGDGGGGTGNTLTGLFSNVEWINPMLTLSANNIWYHIAMVRKNGTTTLYLNGIAGSATTTAEPGTPLGSLRIGSQMGLRFFNGAIDEVKVFSKALSDAEVWQSYNYESSGLIAYYPFNGNANDESGNGNNPTYIGSGVTLTSDRFGNPDKAYYLDGVVNSSYIRIPADNFPTNNRTISFWFNADEISNRPTPLTYGGNGCNSTCFLMNINNPNAPNAYIVQGHCNDAVITAPYSENPVNKWYQFTYTINGSVQKIFINGLLQQTSGNYTGSTYVLGRSVIIGDMIYTDGNSIYQSGYAGAFKGKLDDFRFYNRAMTDSEVLSLYKSEAEDLVAFYPFDGNANDLSGNGHNGTVYGGILTDDRNSNPNSAYTFPNLHNQITLDNTMDLNLQGGFTLNSWVKYKSINSGIIGKHSCWVPNGFYLGIENQQLIFRICDGGWNEIRTSETFETDQWYMITAVFDSVNQTGSVFVDGQLKASGHAAYTVFNSVPITISEASNGCPDGNMPGAIDDVKIFSRPLSETEILQMYKLSDSGLAAYYPFNGNADDASGNLNAGLVTNAVLTSDRYGNANKAFAFDGDNSYIEGKNPGNNLPTGNSSRTFTAWIKDYTYQQWGSNIFHYGTAQVSPTNFHFLITDVLGLGNGYGYGVTYGKTNLIDSTWHFVCGTYSNTDQNVKLYIDGKLDNSAVLSTTPNTVLATNWRIGMFMAGGTPFNGKLDEIRVLNTILNDQEIRNLYLYETTAPTLQQPSDQETVATLTPIMQWNSPFTNAEYKFQLASESSFTEMLYQVNTTNSSVQLPDGILAKDITYYWRVRTTLNGETGPWSNIRSFNFVNTGFSSSKSNLMNLLITPNPADYSSKVTYTETTPLARQTNVSIEIINSMGKIINCPINTKLIPGSYEFQLNTEMMEAGIYFVQLKAGNTITVRKLVIMH
jgi:hypothetical protein